MEALYNTINHLESTYTEPRPLQIQNTIDALKAITLSYRPPTPPAALRPCTQPTNTTLAVEALLMIRNDDK